MASPFPWAEVVETPAFVLDSRVLRRAADAFAPVREETGVRVLYALKPLAHPDVLEVFAPRLDGFAASSLNEALVSRQAMGTGIPTVSVTTPGYRPQEMTQIGALCDHVVLNSLGQWERFADGLRAQGPSVGLRVNPGLSLIDDPRYDPCRPGSRLGAGLEAVREAWRRGELDDLDGLHFHSNADALFYDGLRETVERVADTLDDILRSPTLRWLNLGGGYPLPTTENQDTLYAVLTLLRERYPHLTLFLEPGAALVREAGFLIASVLDLFESGGETVAVLDTSVNHAPEVFEYQYRPDVYGDAPDNPYTVILTGATCLAGDLFGTYRFADPLRIGDRVVFPQMGAYTLAKAHWFNGVALPTLYTLDDTGTPRLRHRYTHDDYRAARAFPKTNCP